MVIGVLGRIEAGGLDNVPSAGPVILAMNHRALMDGPLIFGVFDRPVACLVKREAFVPVVRSVLVAAGQLSVRRGAIDPAPVRASLQILRAGGVVGVFPEGARGDGRVARAYPGVGYLAVRTGATVVPVACHGSETLLRSVQRRAVRLVVGAPIPFEAAPERVPLNRRVSAGATEQIRAALAALVAGTALVAA